MEGYLGECATVPQQAGYHQWTMTFRRRHRCCCCRCCCWGDITTTHSMLLVDSVADSVALGIERIVVCCFRGCVSVAHEKRYDLPLLLHIDDASLILFLPGPLDL